MGEVPGTGPELHYRIPAWSASRAGRSLAAPARRSRT